jgi:hypothetical protein
LAEADHDQQLPQVGPKTTGEAGEVFAVCHDSRRASPVRVPNQEFRLFGQVLKVGYGYSDSTIW